MPKKKQSTEAAVRDIRAPDLADCLGLLVLHTRNSARSHASAQRLSDEWGRRVVTQAEFESATFGFGGRSETQYRRPARAKA